VKGYNFLFWAYTIVWLGIAGYGVFLAMRIRRVDQRLDRIEAGMKRRQSGPPEGAR
jgi:CcmD family protein